jgi:hypothetical protein
MKSNEKVELAGDLAGELVAKKLYYCSKNRYRRKVARDIAGDPVLYNGSKTT